MHGVDQPASPPPGWHPDPSGQPGWRWWDGIRWTQHTAPPVPPGPAWPGGPDPYGAVTLQAGQARLDRYIAIGVLVWAALSVVGVLVNASDANYYRALWHWWHAVLHAVSLHETAPRPPARPLGSSLFSLAGLVLLAIEIPYFIWQYRAASVARALGYPMRHSPGWGVGCWFIPVVNLWMPYQAVRDCLPAGHPARRRILQAWVVLLAIVVVLNSATVVALVGAPRVGAVLVVVTAAAYAFVGLTTRRFVLAIAADHREAVAALTS